MGPDFSQHIRKRVDIREQSRRRFRTTEPGIPICIEVGLGFLLVVVVTLLKVVAIIFRNRRTFVRSHHSRLALAWSVVVSCRAGFAWRVWSRPARCRQRRCFALFPLPLVLVVNFFHYVLETLECWQSRHDLVRVQNTAGKIRIPFAIVEVVVLVLLPTNEVLAKVVLFSSKGIPVVLGLAIGGKGVVEVFVVRQCYEVTAAHYYRVLVHGKHGGEHGTNKPRLIEIQTRKRRPGGACGAVARCWSCPSRIIVAGGADARHDVSSKNLEAPPPGDGYVCRGQQREFTLCKNTLHEWGTTAGGPTPTD
mmetsp:Transcript_23762/g.60052  ORF Transcript_23762/g.60052 Transcript_23762/m.60052 type:complete len:307 (-) Transcript_23762:103-1023(-)